MSLVIDYNSGFQISNPANTAKMDIIDEPQIPIFELHILDPPESFSFAPSQYLLQEPKIMTPKECDEWLNQMSGFYRLKNVSTLQMKLPLKNKPAKLHYVDPSGKFVELVRSSPNPSWNCVVS